MFQSKPARCITKFLRRTFWDMTDAIQLIQVFSLQMSCVPIFTVWNHHDSSDKNNLKTVLQQTARCIGNWEMPVSLTNSWIRCLPTRTKFSLSKNFMMIASCQHYCYIQVISNVRVASLMHLSNFVMQGHYVEITLVYQWHMTQFQTILYHNTSCTHHCTCISHINYYLFHISFFFANTEFLWTSGWFWPSVLQNFILLHVLHFFIGNFWYV